MKSIDLPPIWLLVALGIAYWTPVLVPFGPSLDHPVFQSLALVFIGSGFGLTALAVFAMRRHKTTVIPHMEANTLVRSGIFAWSRNPIYLGDVMLLVGFILRWDAVLAAPLVPVLVWILRERFICPEEGRLAAKFGPAFASYAAQTRRWL